MSKLTAAITGVAYYTPPDILSNADLEKMVETNHEWIVSRTGIEERRILKGEGKATSFMGAEAVKSLLEKTGTDPMEVDLIICGTVTGDMVFPDTANQIGFKTGCKNAFGFDINAACSGFLYSINTGAQFIETGKYKKVIVVGADMMSSIVDYEDRATCILFGDAAGAVMLEPNEDGFGIQESVLKADGSGVQYLNLKAGGSLMPASHETVDARLHYAYQEGRTVFKHAVKGMVGATKELLEITNTTPDQVDWIIPHQANLRILESVAHMMDFPIEKVLINIAKYGNTTSATIPLCMGENEKRFKKGDKVVLTAFGGGFTWGSTLLTWAYDPK